MTFESIFAARGSRLAARGSRLAARGGSALALTLALGLLAEQPASAQFMHESAVQAVPYDVDLTPNGLISIVRGNSSATPINMGSDQRVSFWRTDVTLGAQLFPNLSNAVGRGSVTTSNGVATFSNAVAANNERAVIIGSADTNFDTLEDTTYADVVAFDYTQSPPTVTVLATHALTGTGGAIAGYVHDVAITPDGVLAVVTSQNWIHVFELMTGSQVAAFNVGGVDSPASAGPCLPGFSRNSLEVTNDHAVVTMSRPLAFPGHSATWVYVVDLSYSPPTTLPSLVLEHEPFSGNVSQRKPHDLAISPNGTLAGISSFNFFALYDLGAQPPNFVGGDFNSNRWKDSSVGCAPVWDSIEMTNEVAVVVSNEATFDALGVCEWRYHWTTQVFAVSRSSSSLVATLNDTTDLGGNLTGHPNNQVWDLVMSEEGDFVAIKGSFLDFVVLDVDTLAPSIQRFGGYGTPVGSSFSGALYDPSNSADILNDAVVINRGFVSPSLPPPNPPPANGGVHRWIAFLGKTFGTGVPSFSDVVLYDLPVARMQPPLAPSAWTRVFEHKDPLNVTWVVDIQSNASKTEVLVRDSAPPDESNPATGGRDWHRYSSQSAPASQVGSSLGGSGFCIGVDNLIQRRGVVVSISRLFQQTSGFVHVVRTF